MNTFFFDDVQYPEGLFGGKDFFNPIIYSTEEREVGVWTNGKPLYAKTFIQQLSGNAGQVDISACGADMMFAYSGYYDIGVTMLGLNERLNNQYLTYTHVKLDTMQYIDCCNTIATNSKIIVCCLYTKINDVAGSGSYTTLGVPAVHYTTDEQVIGTWLGETLYRKIVSFDNVTINANGFASYQLSQYINNLSHAIFHKTVAITTGGYSELPSVHVGEISGYAWSSALNDNELYISRANASGVTADYRVVVEYTKTS